VLPAEAGVVVAFVLTPVGGTAEAPPVVAVDLVRPVSRVRGAPVVERGCEPRGVQLDGSAAEGGEPGDDVVSVLAHLATSVPVVDDPLTDGTEGAGMGVVGNPGSALPERSRSTSAMISSDSRCSSPHRFA